MYICGTSQKWLRLVVAADSSMSVCSEPLGVLFQAGISHVIFQKCKEAHQHVAELYDLCEGQRRLAFRSLMSQSSPKRCESASQHSFTKGEIEPVLLLSSLCTALEST